MMWCGKGLLRFGRYVCSKGARALLQEIIVVLSSPFASMLSFTPYLCVNGRSIHENLSLASYESEEKMPDTASSKTARVLFR